MRRKKRGKSGFLFIVLFAAILLGGGFFLYQRFFPSVHLKNRAYILFHIRPGETTADIAENLYAEGVIADEEAFEWLAGKMKLADNMHPGRYRITNGMSMRHIINLFRYNRQEKVKLSYNTQIRNLDEFVRYTADKLALEEEDLEEKLRDGEWLMATFGLDPSAAFALVQPGTYEVSWAITADALFELLKDAYRKTWNATRVAKAKALGFSPAEVITLASIVQSESGITSEQRKIAGVYLNRLRRNMRLEADPTLKFANKVYDVQRVLDTDKQTDSPYNTYRYKGLPPGPICLVNVRAIDATLNYERHNYFYFCAKAEMNGYSNYSSDYNQHRVHAAAYRKALNRMGINR